MDWSKLSTYFRRELANVQPAALRFSLNRSLCYPQSILSLVFPTAIPSGFEIAWICIHNYNWWSIIENLDALCVHSPIDPIAIMSDTEDSVAPKTESRMRSQPAIVPLLLAGVFMVVGICVLLIIGREKARIIGQTITEMDIRPLLNTESPMEEKDMKGKVVVLHFWGYWCPDCVKELPDFVKTQRKYSQDTEVLFASIACSNSGNETPDSLKFYTNKFLQRVGANDLPTYSDPVEFSRKRLSQLMTAGGFSYPTTLVVDGAGRVVDVWRSAVPPNALAKAIEKAKLANKVQL